MPVRSNSSRCRMAGPAGRYDPVEARAPILVMTLLVTGASGLLGANLVLAARDAGWSVSATSGSTPVHVPGKPPGTLDLTEPGVAARLLDEVRPDVVIHAAAGTNVDRCEADHRYAARMNEAMAREVAIAARTVGARLVHISTDAVFGADDLEEYAEEDPTGPCNGYGRSKLAGEVAVLNADPGALVVRTNIYGWNAEPKESLAEHFVGRLRRGETAMGFADVRFAPILANDLADQLLRLACMNVAGVLHVTGRGCVTKADFGRRLAQTFGYDADLVRPVSVVDAGLGAPRPRRTCLKVSRAEAILGPLPTVNEGISRFRELEEAGLPARLRGLLEGAS